MQGTHLIFELLFTSLFISLSAGVFSGTVLVSSPFSLLSFPWQSHPCHGFQVLLSVPSKFPSPAHSTAGIYVQLPVELNMSTTVLIISLPPNILLSLCSLSQGMVPPTSPESQKPGTALDTSLFLTTPIKNPPHDYFVTTNMHFLIPSPFSLSLQTPLPSGRPSVYSLYLRVCLFACLVWFLDSHISESTRHLSFSV